MKMILAGTFVKFLKEICVENLGLRICSSLRVAKKVEYWAAG